MNVQIRILSREVSEYLWRTQTTVSTAESCTAGLVSAAIASIPGASAYFRGGIVCYTDEVKADLLNVPADLLQGKGAVSEEVARAMVAGAVRRFGTDFAIAVTGFAGPGGGAEAPVGTIWIAVGGADEVCVRMLTEDNGRDQNLLAATHTALNMLLELLKSHFPETEEEQKTAK